MKYEDPVKEFNKQKYLNDVALKSRYDMLYITKTNSLRNSGVSQKKCYRNYPSPCRDKDLLDFKVKATHESIKSYLHHNAIVNNNINNSDVLNTLESIDQTATVKLRLNSTIEEKGPMINSQLSTISNRHTTKNFKVKTKLIKKTKPIVLKPMKFTKGILLPKIGRSLYVQPSKEIKQIKCIFPKEKNTPILCTEFPNDDLYDTNNPNNSQEQGIIHLTKKERDEIAMKDTEKTVYKFVNKKKGEKKAIRLCSLLKKGELNVTELQPKEKKKSVLLENLHKNKEHESNTLTQQTIQSTLTEESGFPSKKRYKDFDYYDNLDMNNYDTASQYPVEHMILNYVFKKNNANIRNAEKKIENIENKVAETFIVMRKNVISIITDPNNLKDFY